MSPESGRLLAASAVLAAYAVFCGLVAWRAARRRRLSTPVADAQGGSPMLVAYASQTGFAEELAQRTAAVLQAGAIPVRVSGVDGLDAAALASARRALFVISTTGEGDAPDSAARFVRKVMGSPAALSGLDYGLLALGDSSYVRYCDFGRRVDAWLQAQGATPLFDRIEVDGGAADALARAAACLPRAWSVWRAASCGAMPSPSAMPPAARWRMGCRNTMPANAWR